MRSSLAIRQRWIFFVRVKVWSKNNPSKHLFSVGSSHITLFHFTLCDSVVSCIVYTSYFTPAIFCQIKRINLCCSIQIGTRQQYFVVYKSNKSCIVHIAFSQLYYIDSDSCQSRKVYFK